MNVVDDIMSRVPAPIYETVTLKWPNVIADSPSEAMGRTIEIETESKLVSYWVVGYEGDTLHLRLERNITD